MQGLTRYRAGFDSCHVTGQHISLSYAIRNNNYVNFPTSPLLILWQRGVQNVHLFYNMLPAQRLGSWQHVQNL